MTVAPAITLAHILAAQRVIEGHVLPTPMLPAPKLSALTGAEVFVKYENLQVTNSFKERGARVKLRWRRSKRGDLQWRTSFRKIGC